MLRGGVVLEGCSGKAVYGLCALVSRGHSNLYLINSNSHSSLPTVVTSVLFSVSVNLPNLGTSCK